MSEYYCFATQPEADACAAAINGSGWFPIVGNVNGTPAPQNQQTTQWVDGPMGMASGEWAVPRVPESKLDQAGVPQADRDAFLAAFGQDIRELDGSDFPQDPEE